MSPLVQLTDAWTWVALGVGVIGSVLLIMGLVGDRSRGRRRCPRCWYSMQGVAGLVCPECGRTAANERRLLRSRRRWRLMGVGLVVILCGGGTLAGRIAIRDGVWTLAPFSASAHLLPWYDDAPTGLCEALKARLKAGPLREWQRRHLYERIGLVLDDPGATERTKLVTLELVDLIAFRDDFGGRFRIVGLRIGGKETGEAAGSAATLIRALDDPSPKVRQFAVGLLGTIRGDPALILPAILPMIDTDSDLQTRKNAVATLEQLGNSPEAARLDIVPRLRLVCARDDSDAALRMGCLDAAGALSTTQHEAVEWLAELLGADDDNVVQRACFALRKARPGGPSASATGPLLRVLAGDDLQLATDAGWTMRALALRSDATRAAMLVAIRTHADEEGLFAACASLFRGDEGIGRDLFEAVAEWPTHSAGVAAAYACRYGADPREVLPILERAIRAAGESGRADADVYKWAFLAPSGDATLLDVLHHQGPTQPPMEVDVWIIALAGRLEHNERSAVDQLAALVTTDVANTSAYTQQAAVEAIGHHEVAAQSALPALRALLSDKNGRLQQEAREAIGRITGEPPPRSDDEAHR